MKKKLVLGITGASGSVYARRLVEVAAPLVDLFVIHSEMAIEVFRAELDLDLKSWLQEQPVHIIGSKEYASPLASGSNSFDAMIIMPCSMKTLAQVALGTGDSMLTRLADVALKEKRPLILVPREAPLTGIHLENMLRISREGGIIFPAAPGFYHRPRSLSDLVDFVVGRVAGLTGLTLNLFEPYNAGRE